MLPQQTARNLFLQFFIAMRDDNSIATVYKLLKCLRVPVTRQSVREELESHPDHPSLLAISDVLRQWEVHNSAYRVDASKLIDVPCPFIAHLSPNGGEFVMVQSIDSDGVGVANEKWSDHKISLAEFSRIYSGSLLIVEPGANAGERDYSQKRRQEVLEALRLPLLIIGAMAILLTGVLQHSSYLSSFTWQLGFLTLIKSLGVLTSVLLLVQSIDANNPLIQRLCSGGKNIDCTAILSSKAAKVFGGLSWSEVGFFYFTGTWLVLLFNPGSIALLQVLAVFTILSLPYTVYSLYYQGRVAKQWCVLCCAVQALLWLEFASLLPFLTQSFTFPDYGESGSLFIGLTVPVFAWALLKPFLLKAQQVEPLKQQLKKFKFNADLFQRMLTEQPCYASPDQDHSIVLGNAEAKQIITMVSNPFCPPCSKAHQTLNEWLTKRDDIQLRVVFSTLDNEEGIKTKIARHLLQLNAAADKKVVHQALHGWYGQKQKSYETWAKLYPVADEAGIQQTIEKQKAWCRIVNVEYTPTILLNGYKLPKLYQLEDIKYFI
jgi:protein-disulfide isomerase/uncharacterized membrane protein